MTYVWMVYTTNNAPGVATAITCAPQNRICEIGANRLKNKLGCDMIYALLYSLCPSGPW